MGKAHRPWEELEGQRLRIDVGSTKEEALASQENSTIYFTKDKSIVMNGVAFSDGTAQHPVMVNVCRAIPTRPRKGQVYFFENRVFYRLHRDKMQDGETFSLFYCQIALGGDGEGLSILPTPYPESITKSNWPAGEYSPEILIIEYKHQCFVRVEKDGFVGEQGVLRFMSVEDFISGYIVPTSPNFAFRRETQYYNNGISAEPRLSVKCIAEPPARAITWNDFKKYANFLIKRKRHRYMLEADGNTKVERLPITREVAEVSLCRTSTWVKKKFFVLASIKRRKVSEKKVFVRRVDSLDFPGTYYYAVEPLRER